MKVSSTLPEAVSGEKCYGFARHSIEVRLVDIMHALVEKQASGVEQHHIQPLIDEIKHNARLTPLRTGPDRHLFNAEIENNASLTWLSAPWLFVELYFYRRLYDALDFFLPTQDGGDSFTCGRDPFAPVKTLQLNQSLATAEKAAKIVLDFLDVECTKPQARMSEEMFFTLMNEALWGNKGDLSHNPTGMPGSELFRHYLCAFNPIY
jgi:hypothetical protein